ncbi:MAG: putative DNA binding domain-containing protein, partial [Micrococcales bacterium]|nr:putative DNA binding domain-containing protein [Micrococcales bacterium]
DADGRVEQPESKTREYKLNLGPKERIVQALVAFANSAGGQLVVGVRDDLTVVGVRDPLKEMQRLAHMIADSIRPQLAPPIDLVTLDGKTVLVADVSLGSQRPYHLASVGKYGGTYYRTGAGNRQAGNSMVDELGMSAHERNFDALPCLDAKMSDLDLPGLSKVLGRDLDEAALRTLHLVREEQGLLRPTNAGVLVAAPNPELFLPFAWVQCARFRGPGKRNITDQVTIYGPVLAATGRVMEFLRTNAFLSADFSGKRRRREDVWSIPMEPLKELVVNAMVHSSYRNHGTPIKVAFEDEKIWIESPGGLVPGMTVEKMKRGESALRNPVLARIFKETGVVEAWGTGVPAVLRAIADEGLPEPEFEESVERLRITVHIANHDPRYFAPSWQRDSQGEPTGADTPKSSVEVYKSSVEVHELDVEVYKWAAPLLQAAESPARTADLLTAAGLSQSPTNYMHRILPLVEAGLLARTIPDKPRSSKQRYTLTQAGRTFLTRLEEGGSDDGAH